MPLKIPYILTILMAEVFAIVVEFALHDRYVKTKSLNVLIASLIANLVSWQLAPLLTYFVFY